MLRALLISATLACSVAQDASAQVKLERKYDEGRKSTVQTEQKIQQVLTLAGMEIQTEVDQYFVLKSLVGKRRDDGKSPIENKYDIIQSELTLPNGASLQFDSGNPDKKADDPNLEPVLQLFRAMAKTTWTAVLGKGNRVESVEGMDDVADSVGEGFKSLASPEYTKRVANQEFGRLPDKPVSKGDTWDRTEVLDFGQDQIMTFQMRYEYVGTVEKDGKTLDQIKGQVTGVTFGTDPSSSLPVRIVESKLKVTSFEGLTLFDRMKGMIVESNDKMRIQGDLKLDANGQEIAGTVDLSIATRSTLQP